VTPRRALTAALVFVFAAVAGGLAPISLPAQGAGPCCPSLPVVATSKNPAPGRAHLELQIADLESIFSNRHLRFNDADGWDVAFAALSRELDPAGLSGLAAPPVPPAVRQMPLVEGGLSDALLHPDAPRHPQKGANRWANTTDPGIVMSALIETLARINKYGEPAGGLRHASLAAARFLAGTLAQVPANAPPASMHLRVFADRAVLSMRTPLAVVRPAIAAQRAARPAPAPPAGELALDDFDRANAVFDIFDSVDEHGRRSTMPLRADESNALFETLIDIASAGRQFGGAAAAGSPQDAVACRAFSALVAFANAATPASDGRRTALLNQYQLTAQLLPSGTANLPRLRVIRTGLIMAGVGSAAEADHLANALVDMATAIGDANPAQNAVQADVVSLVRGLSQSAGAPDHATFRDVFAGVLARRVDVMRERRKGVNQIGRGENGFLDAVDAGPAPIVPLTAACGVDPGKSKPRIYLYAVCVDGLQAIKRPYIGVPMVVEGQFDSPPADAEIRLDVKVGGRTTTLTLKRIDEKGHIYRSDPIVPGKGGQQ